MTYTVLFFTHSGAIKFDRKCKKNNIKCELMPVPRALSSNCSISAKIEYNDNIDNLIDDEIEKIFLTQNNINKLIFEAE
jgi:peroxiredoxin